MPLSRQSLEMLLDLVEIRLANLEIHDKEDEKELAKLYFCRQELENQKITFSKRSSER